MIIAWVSPNYKRSIYNTKYIYLYIYIPRNEPYYGSILLETAYLIQLLPIFVYLINLLWFW